MADVVQSALPPSPNWYCSAIGDCSVNGVYAFGARNCIYFFNVDKEPPQFAGQISAHSERVTTVSWCKHKLQPSLVASGSEDKTIRVWDAETKTCIAEHKLHQAKVTCLSWSPVMTDLIVSGDDKGHITAWKNGEDTLFGTTPVQEHIFCIATSRISDTEAAVGYKNGLILVLSLEDSVIKVTHKLRGHDGEVHSLAWCPVPSQQLHWAETLGRKAMDAGGHLLISGSKDQTVRLWNTVQGKLLNIWHLPKRSAQKWRDRYEDQGRTRLWLAVCWPPGSTNQIVVSSHGGELVSWNLSKEGKESQSSFAPGHSRVVFEICASTDGSKLFTVSMDRQVIIWDQHSQRPSCTISTLGGFAYSLSLSPLDPGSIAVGVGDNMIRVWHMTSADGPYEAVSLWQGIRAKVMVVRWHCDKEGLLAFGTEDGLVGIYNVLSKRADMSSTYHKKAVYSISWGPPCPAKEGKSNTTRTLYSCGGDGIVLQHNPRQMLEDAVDINTLVKETNQIKHKQGSHTDVAWNSDGTLMALGNEDGSVEVFVPPDLKRVCILNVHKKLVTCLAWHHGYGDLGNHDGRKYKYFLASGSNESTVHVHDLSRAFGDDGSMIQASNAPVTESYRQLAGHTARITALSWSPHNTDFLVSGSYDGTAQVWNVVKNEPVLNYRGHLGRVMSVVWSYLDPDVVFSGGEDFTVRPWRLSQQKHVQPPAADKKGGHSKSKSSGSKKKAKQKSNVKASSESWRDDTTNPVSCEGKLSAAASTESIAKRAEDSNPMLTSDTPLETSSAANTEQMGHMENTSGLDAAGIITTVQATLQAGVGEPSGRTLGKSILLTDEIPRYEVGRHEAALLEAVSPIRNQHTAGEEMSRNISSSDFHTAADEKRARDLSLSDLNTATFRVASHEHTLGKTKGDGGGGKRKKKQKSMFPLSAVADNRSKVVSQEECVTLARQFYGKEKDSSENGSSGEAVAGCKGLVNLGLFGDRRSAYRMLNSEGCHHAEGANLDYQLQLEIWKGNLGGALELAADNKQLVDWLVAMSPLAGHDVWLKTVEKYADQLASQGAHQRAVLYYLACHKVYQAIGVFEKQGMYREAIALAKVRLSPSDPVLSNLYCLWAQKLETESAYEQAAKCYLGARLPAEAIRVLTRRGDVASLANTFEVALLCSEVELASSLALRLTHSSLLDSDWLGAGRLLAKCPSAKAHLLAVRAHQLLITVLKNAGVIGNEGFKSDSPPEDDGVSEDDVRGKGSIADVADTNLDPTMPTASCPWILQAQAQQQQWFLMLLLRSWSNVGSLKMDQDGIFSAYQSLSQYYQSSYDGAATLQQVLVRMAYEISLGFLSALMGKLKQAATYWLHPLTVCSKHCFLDLQMQLCHMLLPRGVESLKRLADIACFLSNGGTPVADDALLDQLFKHFYAFYCSSLLVKLWWRCPEALAIVSQEPGEVDKVRDTVIPRNDEVTIATCDNGSYPENTLTGSLGDIASTPTGSVNDAARKLSATVDKREESTSTLLSSVSTDSIDKQPPGFLSFKQHQAESRRNNLVIGEGKEGPVEGAHDDQNIGEEQACQAAIAQRIQAIYEEQTAKAITDSSSSTEALGEPGKTLSIQPLFSGVAHDMARKDTSSDLYSLVVNIASVLLCEQWALQRRLDEVRRLVAIKKSKVLLKEALSDKRPRKRKKDAMKQAKRIESAGNTTVDSESASVRTEVETTSNATGSGPGEERGDVEQYTGPNEQSGYVQQYTDPNEQRGDVQQYTDPNEQRGDEQQYTNPNEQRGDVQQYTDPNEQRGDVQQYTDPSERRRDVEQYTDLNEQRGDVQRYTDPSERRRDAEQYTDPNKQRGDVEEYATLFSDRFIQHDKLSEGAGKTAGEVCTGKEVVPNSVADWKFDMNDTETKPLHEAVGSYSCNKKETIGLQEVVETRTCVEDETVNGLSLLEDTLVEQLHLFHHQDLPFPDTMESAFVIAHFCTHQDYLSHDNSVKFLQLAEAVLRWAMRHAQTRDEIKRIQTYLSLVRTVDRQKLYGKANNAFDVL